MSNLAVVEKRKRLPKYGGHPTPKLIGNEKHTKKTHIKNLRGRPGGGPGGPFRGRKSLLV